LEQCFSFSGEISLYFNKEIGKNLEISVSLVQIQLILLFIFLVKFCQNFDMKKMGKKKHQFGGWCKEILCSSIQFENLSLLSKVLVIHKIN
jgi:hypothetical protein